VKAITCINIYALYNYIISISVLLPLDVTPINLQEEWLTFHGKKGIKISHSA
jgi:hypothetical protein